METPNELANKYIQGKIILPILCSVSNLRKVHKKIIEKDKDFPFLEHFDDQLLEYYANPLEKQIKDEISEIKKYKLNTLNKLKIKPAIKENIYIALYEFTQAILLPETNFKKINKDIVKLRRDTIKYLEKALKYPLLEMHFKASATNELNRLKEYDRSEKKTYNIFTELAYNSILYGEEGSILKPMKQINELLLDSIQTPISYRRGRGKKLIFKALQVVIYNYLHEESYIPIEEAKKTVAEIINEYIKKYGKSVAELIHDVYIEKQGISFKKIIVDHTNKTLSSLPIFTFKSIDNALHSSG